MPRNVEIKAKVADRPALLDKISALNPHDSQELHQKDTFFNTPRGRLKLREFHHGGAELIYYHRPDQNGPKLSTYSRCPVIEPAALSATLAQAYGVLGVVEKVRHVYWVGQTRVHVDQVKHLGDFMELEVVLEEQQSLEDGEQIAHQLMHQLGVESTQLVNGAYMDLLR